MQIIYVIADYLKFLSLSLSLSLSVGNSRGRKRGDNKMLSMLFHRTWSKIKDWIQRSECSFHSVWHLIIFHLPPLPSPPYANIKGRRKYSEIIGFAMRDERAIPQKLVNECTARCVSRWSSPRLRWTISIPYMSRERVIRSRTWQYGVNHTNEFLATLWILWRTA